MTDKTTAVNLTGDEIQTIMTMLDDEQCPEGLWAKLVKCLQGKAPLTWTANRPTEFGWYWWRTSQNGRARVVETFIGKEAGTILVDIHRGALIDVRNLGGQWGSSDGVTPTPLQEPEG